MPAHVQAQGGGVLVVLPCQGPSFLLTTAQIGQAAVPAPTSPGAAHPAEARSARCGRQAVWLTCTGVPQEGLMALLMEVQQRLVPVLACMSRATVAAHAWQLRCLAVPAVQVRCLLRLLTLLVCMPCLRQACRQAAWLGCRHGAHPPLPHILQPRPMQPQVPMPAQGHPVVAGRRYTLRAGRARQREQAVAHWSARVGREGCGGRACNDVVSREVVGSKVQHAWRAAHLQPGAFWARWTFFLAKRASSNPLSRITQQSRAQRSRPTWSQSCCSRICAAPWHCPPQASCCSDCPHRSR